MSGIGADRGLLSRFDRGRSASGKAIRTVQFVLLAALLVSCLGPMLMMIKMAITPTQETLQNPFSWFSSGTVLWNNLPVAWDLLDLPHYLWNTMVQTVGSAILAMIVATTAGFALSVLRPRFGNALYGLVVATLFIPNIVTLVPLYLTILDLPLPFPHDPVRLINTPWAIWLPSAASAFNVVIVKRFFDTVPSEYLEAARLDGAGPFRLFTLIVMPLSRPIVGVVMLLTFMNTWKEYLWPMLAVPDQSVQPLSVAIPNRTEGVELSVAMSGLLLAIALPILLFLIFQRPILKGISMGAGIKG